MRKLEGMNQKGGMLREMLLGCGVVFAVLGVGFPYYASMKESAQMTSSVSNLRQWGIALNLYLLDHSNELPSVGAAPADAMEPKAWYNALPSYLGEKALGEYPANLSPRPGQNSIWMERSTKNQELTSNAYFFNYAMNGFLRPEGNSPLHISFFSRPGQTVFMTTSAGSIPWIFPDQVVYRWSKIQSGILTEQAPVLFLDGHVLPVLREELVEKSSIDSESTDSKTLRWQKL